MRALFDAFGGFGQTIGTSNLAVWFVKKDTGASRPAPEDYDADEAGDYCATYKLSANDSPHIVVTTEYPKKNGVPGNYYAVSLNRLDQTNRLRLLGDISNRIRQADFNSTQFDSDRYWRRWRQVLEDSAEAMGTLIRAMNIVVNAGAVKFEFDGSKLPARNP